jgi:hypothetical protein
MPLAPPQRRRLTAVLALAGTIITGLAIHALLPDTDATDIVGDALYAAAAYLAAVLLVPRIPALAVGALALTWCVGVELFQLTGIPLALGASFPPAMLVLGTVFDARDLLVYAVTIVAVSGMDAWVRARRSRSRVDGAALSSVIRTVSLPADGDHTEREEHGNADEQHR